MTSIYHISKLSMGVPRPQKLQWQIYINPRCTTKTKHIAPLLPHQFTSMAPSFSRINRTVSIWPFITAYSSGVWPSSSSSSRTVLSYSSNSRRSKIRPFSAAYDAAVRSLQSFDVTSMSGWELASWFGFGCMRKLLWEGYVAQNLWSSIDGFVGQQ